MILTSCDELDLLAKKVLNKLWLEDVFSGSVSKLSLLTVTKSIQAAVSRKNHRVFTTSFHCLNYNISGHLLFSFFLC